MRSSTCTCATHAASTAAVHALATVTLNVMTPAAGSCVLGFTYVDEAPARSWISVNGFDVGHGTAASARASAAANAANAARRAGTMARADNRCGW